MLAETPMTNYVERHPCLFAIRLEAQRAMLTIQHRKMVPYRTRFDDLLLYKRLHEDTLATI